ncbi:MAG: GNAT family N-acetyltransferase [Rhodanobacter sp.]|nr:MAG: GNAT family N-acetyltransferase [Rhodanobacter sp.]
MPVIRRAESTDAPRLAELAELTFRHTFEAANTPEDMRLHCATHYGEVIQAREISDPEMATLVGEHDGQLVGFAQLRWGHSPDCIKAERPAEIQRLYVREAWHGKGIAQDLMAESIALAKAAGADQVWLGVWEHNPRAIAFYRKWGFAEVGAHVFPVGTDPQRDIIMTRVLGSK